MTKDPPSSRKRITDVEAVEAEYIAVTPLYYDLCARKIIDTLEVLETETE